MTSKRGAAKARRQAKKRARRIRAERDKRVTAEHGGAAHRSCGRKARYPDEESAMLHATRYMILGAPTLRAYWCRYCGGWHLTKTEKWVKDKREDVRMAEKDYRVHERTRRAAAIDARLGMGAADIAASLGITEEAVARAVEEFAGASDEELGMAREGAPEGDPGAAGHGGGQSGAEPLRGTFWVVMGPRKPVTLCADRRRALAVSTAINRALHQMGASDVVRVESVEAWEGDGDAIV